VRPVRQFFDIFGINEKTHKTAKHLCTFAVNGNMHKQFHDGFNRGEPSYGGIDYEKVGEFKIPALEWEPEGFKKKPGQKRSPFD